MIYSATLIATIVVSSRLNGTHSVIALEANTNGPKGLPVSSSFADPRDRNFAGAVSFTEFVAGLHSRFTAMKARYISLTL